MTLDEEDRKIIGELARAALAAAVIGRPYIPPEQTRPGLLEKRGCFVTIRTDGALRGCLGCFTSHQPLYLAVAEYTRHSALEDPRFKHNLLKESEIAGAELDISVLSPLEECRDPEAIIPGVHGIYVVANGRSGCFLPQVATEMGWSAKDFWGHCCRDKAGLDWDAWRRPDARRMTFTAEVFDC